MAGAVIMDWLIWGIKNILEYTMERTNLLGEEAILMGLKASGVLLKQGSQSSVESRKIPFTITLKNVSLDSITDMKICTKLC